MWLVGEGLVRERLVRVAADQEALVRAEAGMKTSRFRPGRDWSGLGLVGEELLKIGTFQYLLGLVIVVREYFACEGLISEGLVKIGPSQGCDLS